MKVKLEELEKAINWIKKNSNEVFVRIESQDAYGNFQLKTYDKDDREVLIKFSEEDITGTKIVKTETL